MKARTLKELRTLVALDPPYTCWFYALHDPRISDPIQSVRWVGMSRDIVNRYQKHRTPCHKSEEFAKWLLELRALKLAPVIEIIDKRPFFSREYGERVYDREWTLIGAYKAQGSQLLNIYSQ